MKAQIEFVSEGGRPADRLALIEPSGDVWVTFSRPWWDFASWIWFFLAPGARRWVQARHADGRKVRVRAFRVARVHVRVGGQR